MNLRTELFIAWRYLQPKRNAVSVITCISLVGVALGVAVLIVVLAVMTGFTSLMKEKLLETTAHIQISDPLSGYIRRPSEIIKKMKECSVSGTPVTTTQVLVQKGERFYPKALIGINPDNTGKMDIAETIKYGQYSLKKGEAIISRIIASQLNAYVGEKILIHSPSRLSKMVNVKKDGSLKVNEQDVYLPEEFTITAVYSFGKYDFDRLVIFTNIDDADELAGLPWGTCSGIYAWAKDPFDMEKELDSLKKKLPDLQITTWKQINSRLLGALTVEKNTMFFLLVFIVLVAAFSITNTLITVVVQKTREIGLLKAIGSTSGSVMRVFILQGFFVGVIGTVLGTALGILIIYYRNSLMRVISKYTGVEFFPKELYFFNELPAKIVTSDLVWIAVISIILCTVGGLIPAWRAARLAPAKALRYE